MLSVLTLIIKNNFRLHYVFPKTFHFLPHLFMLCSASFPDQNLPDSLPPCIYLYITPYILQHVCYLRSKTININNYTEIIKTITDA